MTARLDLTTLHLAKGSHSNPDAGLCLLEAAAFMAGEPHSDAPACVSRVLGTFGTALNDVLPDDRRQHLVPFVPRLLNTAGDRLDEQRSYLALDWLIRTYLPTWLRLVPALVPDAVALETAHRIDSLQAAQDIGDLVRASASHSAAASAAARDAAGDAAGAAAGDAAGDAARDAAGAAAGAAAGDAARAAAGAAASDAAGDAAEAAAGGAAGAAARAAAWAAAGDAAWAAAGAAARAAAWAAAGDAARAAAGDAAGDAASAAAGAAARAAARDAAGDAAGDAAWGAARDAARAAARDALQPTVDALQASAISLYTRMIEVAA